MTAPAFVPGLQVRCLPAVRRLGPFVTYLRGDGHEERPGDLGDGLEGRHSSRAGFGSARLARLYAGPTAPEAVGCLRR